jgi:hypothetical protein
MAFMPMRDVLSGHIKMYGPPLGVKQKNSRLAEVVCKNVSGLLVERTPGHDEDSRAQNFL